MERERGAHGGASEEGACGGVSAVIPSQERGRDEASKIVPRPESDEKARLISSIMDMVKTMDINSVIELTTEAGRLLSCGPPVAPPPPPPASLQPMQPMQPSINDGVLAGYSSSGYSSASLGTWNA